MAEDITEFLAPLDDGSESEEESNAKQQNIKTAKKRHKALLDDVGKLSGKKKKRLKKNLLSEPSEVVSELHWTTGKGDSEAVEMEDLVGCLQNTTSTSALKKSMETFSKKTTVLDAPLPKHEVDEIQRTVAYQQSAEKISNWAATVQKNRSAETLSFPMNQYVPPDASTKTLASSFKPRTSLEEEIAAVLNKAKPILERKDKELTQHEEDALKGFDMAEALQRRKELQKMRALQSYYEAKCKRIRKIKSKKFHRIQRKAEAKKTTVDLEKLAETNPELLLSETEKAEQLRALERANLRHRNTSKWAKNLIIKGKSKSVKDREAVMEQLRLSRALTDQKTGKDGDDKDTDDDMDNDEVGDEMPLLNLKTNDGKDNPWLVAGKTSEVADADDGAGERLRRLKPIANKEISQESGTDSGDDANDSADDWDKAGAKSKLKGTTKSRRKQKKTQQNKKRTTPTTATVGSEDVDEELESDHEYDGLKKVVTEEESVEKKVPGKSAIVDKKAAAVPAKRVVKQKPAKALNKQMNMPLVRVAADSDDENDDADIDENQIMTIREAFANDNVVSEFLAEKKSTVEKDNPKDVNLTLPGWGEWGGKDIAISKKKKKKFVPKRKPRAPRKDDNIVNVIINEARNAKFIKKQVSSVPFPYGTSEQFERSIRQPIGPNWNTPSALSKLVQPRIEKLMGTIIDPIKMTKSIRKAATAT